MTRDTISSGTAGPVTGDDYMDNVAGHVARFWDASALPLTSIGGTADAVTATLTPVLLAALVEGMKFTLTWASDNTGAMTLALNGASPISVLDANGDALAGGAVAAGQRSMIEYVGSAFRLLGVTSGGEGAGPYYVAFTSSGTWTVPTGYADDTAVLLQAWGGGGGGGVTPGVSTSNRMGGGGGAYSERIVRFADLLASYTVTVGAGGSLGNAGGVSSIGSLLTAYAGGGGATGSAGGKGGGALSSGTTSNAILPGGQWGGGNGGEGSGTSSGGAAIFGGGGGGGNSSGSGGTSLRGGNGGASASAGTAPGGGGGHFGAGARGEVRIWIFG